MEITISELKDIIEKAHMKGQHDGCGIDANYNDAFTYADQVLANMMAAAH